MDCVFSLFNAAIVCVPCDPMKQMCGGVVQPPNASNSIAQAPGIAWALTGRPNTYSASRGIFAQGIKHNVFGGTVAAMDPACCTFSAIMWCSSIDPDLDLFGVWNNKRVVVDGIQTCKANISEQAWRIPVLSPTKAITWPPYKKPFKRKAQDMSAREVVCEYPMHKKSRILRTDVAPLCLDVHRIVGCKQCFSDSCTQKVDEIEPGRDLTKGKLRSMPLTAKTIVNRATPEFAQKLKTFMQTYRLVIRVGSMDPKHFGLSSDEIERHGTAILDCFLMFPQVYSVRASSLTCTPRTPLLALRRYWTCCPTAQMSRKTVQRAIAEYASDLTLWGRCPAPKIRNLLAGDGDRTRYARQPWTVLGSNGQTKLGHQIEFVIVDRLLVTRAYLRVYSALITNELNITIQLTPPVVPSDLIPAPPANAASCLHTPNIKLCTRAQRAAGLGTADRMFPTDWINAEYVTWEKLAKQCELLRRASFDAGCESVPTLKINLIGSYSEALNCKKQKFGPTVIEYGATFVELVNVALQKYPIFNESLQIKASPYCDAIEYCDHPDYSLIDAVVQGEKKELKKETIDLCASRSVQCFEHSGRPTCDTVAVCPMYAPWKDPSLFNSMLGLNWNNETPDEQLAIDTESCENIPLLE